MNLEDAILPIGCCCQHGNSEILDRATRRLCDSSGTSTTKLHLLRVGSDGSSSDVVVNQWTESHSRLNTFVPGSFPLIFNEHQYQTGPRIEIGNINMITNADAGAVVSWQVVKQCYVEIQTDPNCPQGGENHLTTTAAGAMAGDVVVDPIVPNQFSPLNPFLQLADGSFVGTFNSPNGSAMVAFDAFGSVRWTLPSYTPQMATADGGIIASIADFFDPGSGTYIPGPASTFDASGAATGQLPIFPSQSWTGNGYQPGSVEQVAFSPIDLVTTFFAQAGGNASANGTAIRPITQDVRALIAKIAKNYVGSQNWLDSPYNKCNLFVHDVLKQAGTDPPLSDKWGVRRAIKYLEGEVDTFHYPALAGDWANPKATMTSWQLVSVPQDANKGSRPPDYSIPGDVIAEAIQYSDATGHVGIIASVGHTISADSAVPCYAPPAPAGTITDSDYGFRPDGWVDPFTFFNPATQQVQPCRTHGYEKNAVVKRFYGQ